MAKHIDFFRHESEFLKKAYFHDDLIIKGWSAETLILILTCLSVAGLGAGVCALAMNWIK